MFMRSNLQILVFMTDHCKMCTSGVDINYTVTNTVINMIILLGWVGAEADQVFTLYWLAMAMVGGGHFFKSWTFCKTPVKFCSINTPRTPK